MYTCIYANNLDLLNKYESMEIYIISVNVL